MHVYNLPTELIIHAFLGLDIRSLLACKKTCRKFWMIIDHSEEIQYHVLLGRYGMISNPRCRQPLKARRCKLQEQEDRWSRVQWTEVSNLAICGKPSLICGSSSTTLVLGIPGEGEESDLVTSLQSVSLDDVPFNQGQTIGRSWSPHQPNMEILENGLSTEEHDLLVVITWDIDEVEQTSDGDFVVLHLTLLQNSTMTRHPDALKPHIRLPTLHDEANELTPFTRVEISGENLAFTVMPTHPGIQSGLLYILHWKTGIFKADGLHITAEGIAFLREDILLSANAMNQSIDIFYIPPHSPDTSGQAEVLRLHSLLLPPAKPSYSITSFDCLCSPNPTSRSAFPSYVRASKPFANDPSRAIIVLTLEICHPSTLQRQIQQFESEQTVTRGDNFSIIVHRRALQDHIAFDEFGRPSIGILESKLPWDVWGPPVTRWIRGVGGAGFIGTTYGQRCISDNPAGDCRKFVLDILDFNPWNVRLARSQLDAGLAPNAVVTVMDGTDENEDIFSYKVFASDITCRLLYVRLRIRADNSNWFTHITEGHLIDLSNEESFHERMQVKLMHF